MDVCNEFDYVYLMFSCVRFKQFSHCRYRAPAAELATSILSRFVAVSMHPSRMQSELLNCLDYIWRMYYIQASTRFSLQMVARSFRLSVTASSFFVQWFLKREFLLIFQFSARRQNLEYHGSRMQRLFLRKVMSIPRATL